MVEVAKPRIKASDFDKNLEVHDALIRSLVLYRKIGHDEERAVEENIGIAFLKVMECMS